MFHFKYISSISLVFILSIHSLFSQARSFNESEELGNVNWYRNYDEALTLAKKEKKDVLILFQEVPGCSTCRNYGHNVLSHPLMVEAIENLFIPLAIFNNKGGNDKKILEKYNEPTWNNPVVRIVNTEGKNVIDRIGNDYSALTLCKRIKESLVKRNIAIPEYVNLLEAELTSKKTGAVKEKCYQMYCFWTGEKQLGKVDGVLSTKSGFANHAEVVKVTYDPTLVSEKQLDAFAINNSSRPVNGDSYRLAANDLHYYLQHSIYKNLPLTEIQKTKINSALGYHQPVEKYLSPKQLTWLNEIKSAKISKTNLLNIEFEKAWASVNN